LRRLTKKHGALLVFDEVMTGFRVDWGGAQKLYSIQPDITCLGKIIGGGFPVGAFGGSRVLMENLSPLGPVYQAGTLSGNPVAMAAGLATLQQLKKKKPYEDLNRKTADLADFIRTEAHSVKLPVHVNQVGSMFTVFFNDQPVNTYFNATLSDTKRFAAFFHALLERGVYLPPSQFEAAFVSTAHTAPIMDKAKTAFKESLKVISSLV
jgi:glutamate-1-semialdehyde 2,1-aminomutase